MVRDRRLAWPGLAALLARSGATRARRAAAGVRLAAAAAEGRSASRPWCSAWSSRCSTGTRPRRGANAFVILADNSQSLLIRDGQDSATRGDWLRDRLGKESAWKTRLGQDFDVRSYAFDSHLRAVDGFDALDLRRHRLVADRRRSRRSRSGSAACRSPACSSSPTATGPTRATSTGRSCPPIYPVVPPSRASPADIGVRSVSISQTNFESAPVVVRADVTAVGLPRASRSSPSSPTRPARTSSGRRLKATGRRQAAGVPVPVPPRARRGQLLPGPRLRRSPRRSRSRRRRPRPHAEQTLGQQQPARRRRPGGRPLPGALRRAAGPNWEFKFLRRALADDEQVAARRPDADRPHASRSSTSRRTRSQPDQPVLRRLRPSRPRHGRAVRPAGPRPPGHARRGRAARRLPQVGRRALPLPRGRPRRPRGRPSSPRTSWPCCATSSASAAAAC